MVSYCCKLSSEYINKDFLVLFFHSNADSRFLQDDVKSLCDTNSFHKTVGDMPSCILKCLHSPLMHRNRLASHKRFENKPNRYIIISQNQYPMRRVKISTVYQANFACVQLSSGTKELIVSNRCYMF
jgi:hypothetical protein